jgi:aryl-alcohol dehydrogenase-like predicted oxidoreductase
MKRAIEGTDLAFSPVIFGTWQAGKRMWAGIDDDETVRALRAGLDAGISTIDTAEVYGDGHSERIVARAIAGRRSEVELLTKVFPNHYRRSQVVTAAERSLQNLGTDVIDLYQLHWPPGAFGGPPVPVSEPLEAMLKLQQEGKIRAIGVSNFSGPQLAEARRLAPVVSLQPPYSLLWRFVEQDGLPTAREHGMAILAYSPLAQGILTGKFGPDHRFAPGDHRSKNRLFAPDVYPRALAAVDAMRPLADRRGCSLAQLALAWILHQPSCFAIAGARNEAQARDNAQAMTVELSPEDLADLDRISRTVTDQLPPAPMLWDFG